MLSSSLTSRFDYIELSSHWLLTVEKGIYLMDDVDKNWKQEVVTLTSCIPLFSKVGDSQPSWDTAGDRGGLSDPSWTNHNLSADASRFGWFVSQGTVGDLCHREQWDKQDMHGPTMSHSLIRPQPARATLQVPPFPPCSMVPLNRDVTAEVRVFSHWLISS